MKYGLHPDGEEMKQMKATPKEAKRWTTGGGRKAQLSPAGESPCQHYALSRVSIKRFLPYPKMYRQEDRSEGSSGKPTVALSIRRPMTKEKAKTRSNLPLYNAALGV